MKSVRNAVLALAASVLIAGPASAALINYNEAIDGDLSNVDPLDAFVLDTGGANTIAGNIGATAPAGTCPTSANPSSDCDSFAMTVVAGLEIVGISVVRSGTTGTLQWRVATGLLDYAGTFIDTLTNTDSVPAGALPLGPGNYNISWELYPIATAGTNYTFTITTRQTVAVPEPATLALLGFGLLGLAVTRGRRR